MRMKKRRIQIEFRDDEEIIQREIKPFGNASHIILPQKHKNNRATIIIHK